MTKKHAVPVLVAVLVSLVLGGVSGFFLGVFSTQAGKAFFESLFEEEERPDVGHPIVLIRERFQLEYPGNWTVDVEDEDYDPDAMFSIESPGAAFVMCVIGVGEMNPEEILQIHIGNFEKLMDNVAVERFEQLGSLTGKGARLKGTILGFRTTTKIFSFCQDGLLVQIVQQCPDADLSYAKEGLELIENSFLLRSNTTRKVETTEAGR